jgi:hypothetical protein
LIVAAMLESALALGAGKVDKARIDAALSELVQSQSLVGVSALVYEEGHEVYFGAFGQADKGFLPMKGQLGFGIDFAVRIRPPANAQEAAGAVGEFFWDGAADTLFWVDPHFAIILPQKVRFPAEVALLSRAEMLPSHLGVLRDVHLQPYALLPALTRLCRFRGVRRPA